MRNLSYAGWYDDISTLIIVTIILLTPRVSMYVCVRVSLCLCGGESRSFNRVNERLSTTRDMLL